MKTLRRLFQRLISWTTTARDEEILRAELDEHIAMPVQALVEYWNQSII